MATTQVINLSHLAGAKRIDPEFYQPDYLLARDRVFLLPTKTIAQMSTRVVSFGAYSLCNYIVWREAGIPYLKAENILDGYINYSEAMFIDEDVHAILSKSEVHEGQVLFSMSGTTGNAAVAYKIPAKLNASQDVAKITLRQGYSPFYVAAFLNSKYGRMQTQREIVGSVQQHVFLWQIKNFVVPIVPKDIEDRVEALQREGLDQLSASNAFYSQAENLLLEELGLKDFQPKYELSYAASLSKAFGVHRVDAEYFQPSYDAIESHLRNNFDAVPIRKMSFIEVTTGQYCEEYVSKSDGAPYIRGADISNETIRMDDLVYIGSNNQDPHKKALEGDVVVTRVGTIGLSARIPKECEGGTISDNLIRLRFNNDRLNSYYLALFLGCPIGVSLMIRNSRGSVQQRLNQETLKEVIVPILQYKTQREIALLVQQSHEARGKAKQLLEEAKSKVENLIEGGV